MRDSWPDDRRPQIVSLAVEVQPVVAEQLLAGRPVRAEHRREYIDVVNVLLSCRVLLNQVVRLLDLVHQLPSLQARLDADVADRNVRKGGADFLDKRAEIFRYFLR